MLSKRHVIVNKDRCVACGACMKECPKSIIKIINGCYAQPDIEKCIGCGKCARICPANCIDIVERGMIYE